MRKTFVILALAGAVAGCDNLPTDTPDTSPNLHRDGVESKEDAAPSSDVRTYRVTIANLTGGQPFSPGVVVTHGPRFRLLRPRRPVEIGLRLIAENGDPSTAAMHLAGARGVGTVETTPRPVGCDGCPGPFGPALTLTVTAGRGVKYLSMALMLICTNDGLAGLDRVRLPRRGAVTYYARAYDTGTEANLETWDTLVDPCGGIGPVAGPQDGTNVRVATRGVLHRHEGIRGVGDLTKVHAWKGPVARVTIERMP